MKVMIAIGSYAPVNSMVYENHMHFFGNEACTLKGIHQIGVQVWRRTPLTVFRSQAVEKAVDGGFDKLVFLDDDLALENTAGTSIIGRMLSHERGFVTTVVHHRNYPFLPMLFMEHKEGQFHPIIDWPRDRLSEIDLSHLAFVMLDVQKLQSLREHEKDLFVMKQGGSDDIRFCRLWREFFNESPWIDPDIRTKHLGKENFLDEESFKNAMKDVDVNDGVAMTAWLRKHGFSAVEVKK